MAFGVGDRIGAYQIVECVGQGGMATIYRARQIALDRDVALKVIHPALMQDESFRLRLNREASIVAGLYHPNIVPIFDYGQVDGVPFIVMRFIDGKTLKAVLQEHPLGIDQILPIARAIGSALQYAHRHSVLHRDVKPSNILIDPDENVFLTDFGLARITYSAESTVSREMMIGSPHYISPEQAKGESVDERSDLYSFGVVLFEMFTGRVPFSADTPYATVLAHINEPPPLAHTVNPETPFAIERVLERTLAKDREDRYPSVALLLEALEEAVRQRRQDAVPAPGLASAGAPAGNSFAPATLSGQAHTEALAEPLSRNRPLTQFWILVIIGALVWCALVASIAMGVPGTATPVKPTPPAEKSAAAVLVVANITSPTAEAPVLPPSLVPTERVLAYSPAPTIARSPTPVPTSATDAARGRIFYSVARGDPPELHSIWSADANGLEPRKIIDMAMWPSASPDGQWIAYYRMKDSGIYVANSDGGNPHKVLGFADTCCVQWSPDSKRLSYFRGSLKFGGTIFTANADGTGVAELTGGFNPAWSPDGNRVAFANCQPNSSQCGLFVMDARTKTGAMLTRDNGANPQWSPRGERIVYQADDGHGHVNVFIVNADGSGAKQLTFGQGNDGQPNWSRDGTSIYWRSDQNGVGWGIYAMRSDGSSPHLVINDVPPDANLWGRESLSTGP